MVFLAVMIMTAIGLKAQDCESLVLPYFNNDRAKMESYMQQVPEKFQFRCAYARSAFYESDTIPTGAEVLSINVVQDAFTGSPLSENHVVNLETLSYYAYNFLALQTQYPSADQVICFTTPASAHPYLILRSLHQIGGIVDKIWSEEILGSR